MAPCLLFSLCAWKKCAANSYSLEARCCHLFATSPCLRLRSTDQSTVAELGVQTPGWALGMKDKSSALRLLSFQFDRVKGPRPGTDRTRTIFHSARGKSGAGR